MGCVGLVYFWLLECKGDMNLFITNLNLKPFKSTKAKKRLCRITKKINKSLKFIFLLQRKQNLFEG